VVETTDPSLRALPDLQAREGERAIKYFTHRGDLSAIAGLYKGMSAHFSPSGLNSERDEPGFRLRPGGWPIIEGWDPWVRKIENYGSFTMGIARATGVNAVPWRYFTKHACRKYRRSFKLGPV